MSKYEKEIEEALSQLKVEVEHITYHNQDNGWTVLKARNLETSHSVTAVGSFAVVNEGECYRVFGKWVTHKQFGKQFKVARYQQLQPTSINAIIRFLSSGQFPGVGVKTAQKITDHFKLETLKILNETPNLLKTVPGLGKKTAEKIIFAWTERKESSESLVFLHQHGLSSNAAQKIYKLFGANTIQVLTQNPYILISEVRGIGFVTADKIAKSLGIKEDAPQRIQEGVLYALSLAEERGHCYLTDTQLREQLAKVLQLSVDFLEDLQADALLELNDSFKVVSTQTADEEIHYLSDLMNAEENVKSALCGLLEFDTSPSDQQMKRIENWMSRYCDQTQTTLSDQQKEAVVAAVTNKVFILTGGPGVGKTTTANTIIKLLTAMNRSVALAAPTGRAAQRLTETATIPAKTIHRLLEWSPADGGFKRNDENPLIAQVVIIDEVSMLDIRLADVLLRAVPTTSQLILIGDVDQLPAVGPGNVLRDLISSDQVPFVRLTQIFRQAAHSSIVNYAHEINRGIVPTFPSQDKSDCRFIEAQSPAEIIEKIKGLIVGPLKEAGYDPLKDIQILTPMNRGELGSVNLNLHLQELLNPGDASKKEIKRNSYSFRDRDKVIQMSNNYDINVFNGDIGQVEHAAVEGGKIVASFESRSVVYESDQISELSLAYAITIHKSQGSEFPVVIMPVSMQHYIMLQRNLIYTGLTRAKKIALFVGAPKALEVAIKNETSTKRQTQLSEKLCNI